MLVELLILELNKNKRENLDKLCSGEIIAHCIGREMVSKFFNKFPPHLIIDTKKREAQIYQIESQALHSSYASILECISPFTEDFDFEGYTGFYRTKSVLEYAEGTMTTTNLTLKFLYILLLKDRDGYEKVNRILLKYNPDIKLNITRST